MQYQPPTKDATIPRWVEVTFPSLTRESHTIAGWAAMWRPTQIYLHDWWLFRQRGRVYEKLSRMPFEVRKSPPLQARVFER